MNKVFVAASVAILISIGYACKKEDNPTTVSNGTQLTATLSSQPGSTSSTTSTATGTFLGQLDQSSTVLSYTITYPASVVPTAVSLDPASTSTSLATGTSPYSNSILLAGSFSTTTTNPGSGTSTSPGSGTSTSPGSGTSTSPGSGTSTSPGSGTSTNPGSGTSTNPGSGTSTSPGSGTSTSPGSGTAVTLTSPLSGTVSLSSTQANNLTGGQYQLTIRSAAYPNGELTGPVRIR